MKNKTLLIIGLVWPEPNSSAAGTRMLQLIELFQKQEFDVVFTSAAQESEFSSDLKSMRVTTQKIELNSSSFDVFIKELNPAIVLFDRFVIEEQFGWRVQENSPNSLRILDTEDLHCLRLARQNAVKKNKDFQLSDLLNEDIAKREIASILRSDLTLIISEFEMTVLETIFKIDSSLLYYLPLFYQAVLPEALLKFDKRKDFIFIGNFLHEPNWDAVRQLKEKIWPQIRAVLPEVKMNVYGAYPSQKVLQLHNPKENFLIHGRAEKASVVIENARVLLAPLRFGAGLKGKLLETMQSGTPSMASSIGAEGISDAQNWNGFVKDDYTEFSERAVLLYQDETMWLQSQKKGLVILQNKFDKKLFENTFVSSINRLLEDKDQHRQQNFIGTLLWHHTTLSTKYMSRWIEEKNK